jgi:polyhydroxyalkanoate synthase
MHPGRGSGEPLLVVAPLINRWYVLDLLPGRSFCEMLCGLGRPVYVLEWRPPEDGDERGLGELCAGPLRDAARRVREAEGAGRVGLIGYCQGGTLAAMLAARFPSEVSRLATVAAPVRFAEAGQFRRWFDARLLDVETVAAGCERVSAWLVHLPFWWLRPTIKTRRLTGLARRFREEGALEQFLAGELWNHDHMDMSRGVFRSWIGELYQRDALAGGAFEVAGEPVALERITQPTLVISGEHDVITPPAAAEALLERVRAPSARALRPMTGHVGLMTSPRPLAEEREAFAAWIGETS